MLLLCLFVILTEHGCAGDFLILNGTVREAGRARLFLVGAIVAVDAEHDPPLKVHWHAPEDPSNLATSAWVPLFNRRTKARHTNDAHAESVSLSFAMKERGKKLYLPDDVIDFLRNHDLMPKS